MGLVPRNTKDNAGAEKRLKPRSRDGLLEQLKDPDATSRCWAARDLCEHPDTWPVLVERLAVEADTAVRTAILTTLLKNGRVEVARGLIRFLRSDDAALRAAVVEALAEMPDSTGEVMEELLRDEDSDVRIMAVMVLASVAHPRVPDWLAHVLQHEEHPNVVLNALDVLADRGTAEQLPHLAGVKQRFRSTSMVLFALDAAQAAMGKRNP